MGSRTELKAIHPHRVVPMRELPDGRLVSASDYVLPSVASSRAAYDEVTLLASSGSHEVNPPLEALVKRWDEVTFDEVCGHWICTWNPHVISEYCYLSLKLDGVRVNLGSHVTAYMGLVGEVPTYQSATPGVLRRLAVDHLCLVKLCCNPAHLEVKTVAENSRASRHAYRQVSLASGGQETLFDPHLYGT